MLKVDDELVAVDRTNHAKLIQIVSIFALIGALWFGGTIVVLTLMEFDFMKSLGWDPVRAAGLDWPSGLALGPQGLWMIVAFALSGVLLAGLGEGLRRQFPKALGPYGIMVAGLAMSLLSFPTDPTYSPLPPTWHGRIHDGAYVLLGIGFLAGLLLLSLTWWRTPGWRGLAIFTWVDLALIGPAFMVKGALFYLFLVGAIAWIELASLRLWRASQTPA